MKKILKRLAFLFLALIVANIVYNFIKPEGVKQYVINKELELIKEDWKGNAKIGKEFINGETRDKQVMPFDILKWKLSKNPQAEEKKQDDFKLKVQKNTNFLRSNEDMIVWLGHATFYIRLNGKVIITDPIFYDITFIKRLAGLPCNVEAINNIDYLLLSHGHRVHFDKKTISELAKNNPNMEALLPLGFQNYFNKRKITNQEAGWYQKFDIDDDVSIYFLPANHWNRRNTHDFNKNLWGSFIIKSDDKTIYFAGDTAYGNHFEEIGQLFETIDYCLLPIGAYMPEIIMKSAHISPLEAIQAFKDLGGTKMIPMHYGTYDLSDEPIGEPLKILKKEQKENDIQIPDIGEEFKI